MSRWCHHIALTPDLMERYRAVSVVEDGDEFDDAVIEWTSALYGNQNVLQNSINHVWEDIHRFLNDDDDPDYPYFGAGDYPLCRVIHDDEFIHRGGRTLSFIEEEIVADIHAALREITADRMREQFETLVGRVPRYSSRETTEERDDWFESVWHEFDRLRSFYKKAAGAKLAVICTISH